MKPSLAALLVLSAASLGQEPSAKDLRGLLHADVKQYANDGRLVASWSLTNPDQLNGFKRQDEKAITVVSGDGLSMAFAPGGRALCLFKELEFEQPCRVAFDVRVETPDSSFEMSLFDPAHPQVRVLCGVNQTGRGRVDLVARVESSQLVGTPRVSPTAAAPGSWTPVVIDFRGDRASLTVGKTEQGALGGLAMKRLAAAFGASAGKVVIRNLAIDTQVNRDSIRKLFRSVAAARPASRPKLGDAGMISRTAWEKVDEENASIGFGDALAAHVDALPAEAQKAIEEGIDPAVKPRQALDIFEKAVKLAPQSAVVLWLAGVAAAGANLPDTAILHLEKAVAIDAKFARAWIALGHRRAERGEDSLALKAFTQAETANPADPWVHVARARLAFDRGRLDDARCEIGKACTKRPESKNLATLSTSLDRLAARPDWKDPFKKENQWYVVETTISSKAAAEMAQRLVVYRRFLEKAFPLPLKPNLPPSRVWIFDSEDEYRQFASSLATGMDGTLGLYHRLIKTLLLTSKVSSDTTQHILFHEGFHQYIDLAVKDVPIWMNEGLAEYYGATTFDVSGKPTEGGLVEMRLSTLREPPVPLDKLMLMNPGVFMNPRGAGLHYAQSWALVHYFKQGGNASAAKLFDFYCTAVINGRSQADAFNLSFGRDGGAELAVIEREFRSYVSTRLLGRK